jgi:KDO2-lipid IV(A) lauroyltransferase
MWRSIKNYFIYHFVMGAVILIGYLPEKFGGIVGGVIGAVAHFVAVGERTRALRHLSSALGGVPSDRRVKTIVRGVFRELGRSVVELCRLRNSPDRVPQVLVTKSSREALDGAVAEGKGVVFVSGHMGNWEMMAVTLAKNGYPISTVAKESYDPGFTQVIDEFRSRFGVRAIFRGRPGASAAMLRILKTKRVLGFMIDQDTSVPSVFVPFFGRMASTPVGAAVFALRTGAPVVVGSIHRRRNGSHVVHIERCFIPDGAKEATAMLTQQLERRIRRHPSDWVWFHERWKTGQGDLA